MMPPDTVNGYHYPPVPNNPSGAPNFAYSAPPRGQMGYGSPGQSTNVPATMPENPYANGLGRSNSPSDTLSNRIPDPMQSGEVPIHTMFPDADEPPGEFYLGVHGTGRDLVQRHSVESTQQVGWINDAPTSVSNAQRFAPNPRTLTYPEGGRVTSRMSPNTFSFTRPYDQRMARRFNGSHFSMADHRREYPVFGMAPTRTWRNTSRVDPPPWDANIVDSPNGPVRTVAPNIPIYDPPMGSQSFVFGA